MAFVFKTIGATGRDYTTAQAWEADLDNGAVYAASDEAIGMMYNDGTFTGSLTIDGGGTIGLSKITLTAPVGQRHDGTAGTGVRFVQGGNNPIVISSAVPVIFSFIEVNGNTNGIVDCVSMIGSASGSIIQQCIFHNWSRNGTINVVRSGAASDGIVQDINNCILYNITETANNSSGLRGYFDNGNTGTRFCRWQNNTAWNLVNNGGSGTNYAFFWNDGAGKTLRNNLGADTVGTTSGEKLNYKQFLTGGTYATNQSSDASAQITNKAAADQFVSTSPVNLHLKETADARNVGTTLSAPPDDISVDIDGQTRVPTWDVGADEWMAAITYRTIDVGQASIMSIVKSASKILNFAQGNVVGLTASKFLQRTLDFVQSNVVSLTAIKVVLRTLDFVQSNVVTLTRQTNKLLNIVQSSLVDLTRIKFVSKVIDVIQSNITTLSTTKFVSKIIDVVQGSIVGLTSIKVVLRTLDFTQTTVVSLTKQTGKLLNFAQSGVITLTKQTSKLLSVVQGNVVSLTSIKVVLRTLSVVQGNVVTLTKQTNKLLNFVQDNVIGLSKRTGKLLDFVQSNVVELTGIKVILRTLSVVQGNVVSLSRSILRSKVLDFVQGNVVSLNRSITKLLNITQGSVVTIGKGYGKVISVVQSSIVSLTSISVVQIFIDIVQGSVVGLSKQTNKILNVIQDSVTSLSKRVGKLISVAQGNIVSVTGIRVVEVLIDIVQGSVVSLGKQTNKILSIVQGNVVSLNKMLSMTLNFSADTLIDLTTALVGFITKMQSPFVSARKLLNFVSPFKPREFDVKHKKLKFIPKFRKLD